MKILVNRWKSFSPQTIAIMLKSSAAFLCLALFIRLALSITPKGSVQTFDEEILRWVETLRTPFLNVTMIDITILGGLTNTIILGTLVLSIFLLARDTIAAIHLLLTSVGGYAIAFWTKTLISRPRPSIIPHLINAGGLSFPSGHSVEAAAMYLTMAILACRHFKSIKKRIILLSLAAVMITIISFSRIYLGVHYPSDTMSGALIGLAWALFMAALFAKSHFKEA